jgi:hypothetical protein
MAIQVSGTEVISNARALNNIASVDATTAASITTAGVGAVPTAVNAVGTYTIALDTTQSVTVGTGYKQGRTTAGSNLQSRGISGGAYDTLAGIATSTSGTSGLTASHNSDYQAQVYFRDDQTYSGSWRLMSPSMSATQQSSSNWGNYFPGLWVRYA